MTRALVVGKFYPPHNGHHFLIESALKESDHLDVLVCDNPKYRIKASLRKQWLQQIHPTATVHIIPDLNDDDNSEAWAEHTIRFLGYAPDIVFSSENYGINYAQFMGCKHRMVDQQRTTIPVSARYIRADVMKYWDFMQPIVRQYFCRRICLIGAESTGTTTLTQALAKHYRAPWAPEIGRYYTDSIRPSTHDWEEADFHHIAKLQQEYEDVMAGLSNGLLLCDTNAFATKVWQERYMGNITDKTDALARNAPADLYIVTGDEIPFVQDGTRDGEHIRHNMHSRIIEELKKANLPYIVVRGAKIQRLQKAIAAIDLVYSKRKTL